MKTVKLDQEVTDVSSLYFDLIQAEFEVLSVGVHQQTTLINLEDEEEKDPIPMAERWVGVPAKAMSVSSLLERKAAHKKWESEKPFRMENLKARYRVSQEVSAMRGRHPVEAMAMADASPEVLALGSVPRESWIKKLLKFW